MRTPGSPPAPADLLELLPTLMLADERRLRRRVDRARTMDDAAGMLTAYDAYPASEKRIARAMAAIG